MNIVVKCSTQRGGGGGDFTMNGTWRIWPSKRKYGCQKMRGIFCVSLIIRALKVTQESIFPVTMLKNIFIDLWVNICFDDMDARVYRRGSDKLAGVREIFWYIYQLLHWELCSRNLCNSWQCHLREDVRPMSMSRNQWNIAWKFG
jgi:hypothetical protein